MAKAGKKARKKKPSREEQEKRAESASLRRLASIRILNDCVDQFYAFASKCESASERLDAFQRYQAKILSALQLRREDTGDVLEADILLINADWTLEQSCATHHDYWRYVPTLKINRGPDGVIAKPKLGEGVATYAVWTAYEKRVGVVVAKNVHKNQRTTTFYEEMPDKTGGGIRYVARNIGDQYMPPEDGIPPYKHILSVPIIRTLKAHSDPLKQPVFESLGVLNITHANPAAAFSQQDFAWALTCASLLGSIHASLYARLPAGNDPNEVLLDCRRVTRKAQAEQAAAKAKMASSPPPAAASPTPTTSHGDTCFGTAQFSQGRIKPWELLTEDEFRYDTNKFDDITEKNVLERLQKYGFVLLRMTSLTPEKDLLKSLENSLGTACLRQNDHVGTIKLITPDPEKEAISGESGKELAAHVDGTQDDPLPPAMLAFQYLEGATHGGHSTFFDMTDVLRGFTTAERTQIIADLSQHDAAKCTKEKKQTDGTTWTGSYKGPLIKPVCGDAAVSVRVRFDRVMEIKPQYQASFDKLQAAVLARGENQRITFLPREGDIAIFDNWRVMHGRLEVSGKHLRHHHRIWFRDLAARHKGSVLLGVRGLSISQLHSVKTGQTPKT